MINEMALEGKSAYAISKALDISKTTIARHKIPNDKRKLVPLPGQYCGLTEYQRAAQHTQYAYKCTSHVEKRNLGFYEQIMEAGSYAGC